MEILKTKDGKNSLVLTGVILLLICFLFFLSAFQTEHPTPIEQELEMIELPYGFSTNAETGGGSSSSKSEEVIEEQVENTVEEVPESPNNIETQTQESSTQTSEAAETPSNEQKLNTPPKTRYGFTSSSNGGDGDNGSESNKGQGSGGKGGDGIGSGKDGFNGIGIGGSLAGRKILGAPAISANCPISKKETIVLTIKVNNSGTVVSAKSNYDRSSTSNACLTDFAKKYVKNLKWNKSNIPEQAGTISIDFKP